MLAILLSLLAGIIALIGIERNKLFSDNKRTRVMAITLALLICFSTIGAIILQKIEMNGNEQEKKTLYGRIDSLKALNILINKNLDTSTDNILSRIRVSIKTLDSAINKSKDSIIGIQNDVSKYTNGLGNIPLTYMEIIRERVDSITISFSVENSNIKLPIRNLFFNIDDWPSAASKFKNPGFMVPDIEGVPDLEASIGNNKYKIYPKQFEDNHRLSIGDLPPNSKTIAYVTGFNLFKLRSVNYKIRTQCLGAFIDIHVPITIEDNGGPLIGKISTKLNSKKVLSKKVLLSRIINKSPFGSYKIGSPTRM